MLILKAVDVVTQLVKLEDYALFTNQWYKINLGKNLSVKVLELTESNVVWKRVVRAVIVIIMIKIIKV